MPRMTGLQATVEIKTQAPDIAVLVLSMYDDERYLFEALQAGAAGYILKQEADTALVEAVRAVWRGEPFMTNAAEASLLREWMEDESSGPVEPLTLREREVLKLIAEAHTRLRRPPWPAGSRACRPRRPACRARRAPGRPRR